MQKRLLSWLLVLCMAITLLPAQALAVEDALPPSETGTGEESEPSAPAEEPACTCGAVPGEDGTTVHQPGCPLYIEPEPSAPAEEPACTCGAVPGEDGTTVHQPGCPLYIEPEEPAPVEEPVCTCGAVPGEGGTMVHQPECPLYEEPEAEPLPLTAPAITAAAYDEETGSMVLTVDGLWDSYAWESCSYGYWIPWEGDGASIVLEKGDFVNRGFRCTVTAGDQSVTSQVYAYDSTALEPPAMVPMAETGNLEETGEYMRYDRAFWNIYRFDIFGLDDGDDIRTTYDDSGYRTVIQVDGSSTKTEVRYREGPTSAANSLQAETNLSFAPGGRYVQVT